MSKRKPDWKNRIIEYGEMPANQYLAHELNARRHPGKQREALIGSLNEVGWVAPVIVSARTGKLLDGHARIEETITKDENAPVPFVKVDVSENEERTILPYLGSGSTMVAAQKMGRKCYGFEMSIDYCAIIIERMATTFPALEIERHAK